MSKRLLKYYFILIFFGLFLSLIKFYVAILAILKIALAIRNRSIRIRINRFYRGLSYVYLYYVFYTIFCVIYIVNKFSYSDVLARFITQQFSMFLLFFQIYMGYQIALRFKANEINMFFKYIIYVLIIFGLYQFFAYNFGFPYIGLYAYDTDFGLRISSLCGEPKFFSSVLVISIFYIKDKIKSDRNIKNIFVLLLLIYLLYRAGSGNGYLSFIILLIANMYLWKPKLLLLGLSFITIFVFFFISNYEYFNLRASHVVIIESIKTGQISFQGWDDLIALPLMSWLKYPFFLISGFGFNLNHFFALEFLKYATWLDGNTYINGNFSIIDYISSFGILLPVVLFIHLTRKTQKYLKRKRSDELKLLVRFTYYIFVVGFFIGGNISIPFFASIGILFYYVSDKKNNENLSTVEYTGNKIQSDLNLNY